MLHHKIKKIVHTKVHFFIGFSLVEILIALTILMVIVTSTLLVFRGASRSWSKGELRAQRYQQARIILQRMTREISSSLVTSWGSLFCYGEAGKFFFICPVMDSLSEETGLPTSELVEVGYYLHDANNTLVRHYDAEPDYNFDTFDSEDELGLGITGLRFSYYDGETWKDTWNSKKGAREEGRLPYAVKIEIVVRDEKERGEETFTTIISLATSR